MTLFQVGNFIRGKYDYAVDIGGAYRAYKGFTTGS